MARKPKDGNSPRVHKSFSTRADLVEKIDAAADVYKVQTGGTFSDLINALLEGFIARNAEQIEKFIRQKKGVVSVARKINLDFGNFAQDTSSVAVDEEPTTPPKNATG